MLTEFSKKLLNFIHIIFATVPFLIYFMPIYLIVPYIHWILILAIMTPLHWIFIDNQCLLTMISKYLGDYKDSQTNAEFTENNLKSIYLPIMKVFKWSWNNDGINKMSTFHWIINILLIWYYIFFYIKYTYTGLM